MSFGQKLRKLRKKFNMTQKNVADSDRMLRKYHKGKYRQNPGNRCGFCFHVLIPAIRDCIRDVDVEQGQMCVHLLPGLLDINRK